MLSFSPEAPRITIAVAGNKVEEGQTVKKQEPCWYTTLLIPDAWPVMTVDSAGTHFHDFSIFRHEAVST